MMNDDIYFPLWVYVIAMASLSSIILIAKGIEHNASRKKQKSESRSSGDGETKTKSIIVGGDQKESDVAEVFVGEK